MKLLLVLALATVMALPAMAQRGKDKERPGEKGKISAKKANEARKDVKGNRSYDHGALTAQKQQAVEKAITEIKGLHNFEFLKGEEVGLAAHGIVTAIGALGLKAEKNGLDATLLKEEVLIENFTTSLKMVNQKVEANELRKEDAELIYKLADMAILAGNKSYREELSAEVKEDIGLVMSMIAQANTMFSGQKIPQSYLNMAREITGLGVSGMAVKGNIRQKMGEELYTQALKNCLTAA